ncbi:IS66 family transposase [Paraburkholderia hospita]|uniref:IS66 family transposase n=1 Tax=Paraburkholderia hospita TaxID=169430 RepID=UPI0009A854F7|nr:IS66 family transposase [Paraburkholderia hospita]SKD06729.1 Transposase [Paraburkholderia hospita]
MPDHAPLPQTVAELHALVLEQQASMAKMRQEIAERDREIVERDRELERLKAQIDKLRRMHFGRKSEQVDRQIDRLETQLEDLAAGSGVADVRHARARASSSGAPAASAKEALPDHLTREERVLEPDCICPKCNNAMDLLGEDVSEQLARVTAMFKVIRTIRCKRICSSCGHIGQRPMPGLPIERSIAHPSLLAEIIVSKCANHTPLYRQSEIAARDGVRLDRATMARWVGQCEELCRLLTEALRRYTMSAAKLHADDTPIPVLAPGNKKTKTGRLWVYVRDDRRSGSSEPAAVWFAYSPDRKGIHPQTHLAGFEGVLQADGYAGFNELTESGKLRLASCWDHARRYVFNVHETTPSETTKQWLDMIGDLYEIEAAIRGKPPDERRRVRQEKSNPLLGLLEMSMREKLATLWPKAPLVEAINYSLNRWDGLTLFCDDGRVEISNVLAENALRCVALGRRNFMFAGSDSGGERAAAMYSLIGSCKLNNINPRAYLEFVLTHIADHQANRIDELLPWNVAKHLLPSTPASL